MKAMKITLKTTNILFIFLGLSLSSLFAADNEGGSVTHRILIAYFSHSGNTRAVAEKIKNTLKADIFEIKTVKPYPEDYNTVVDQAKEELHSGFKPELLTKVENLSRYDVIFIGYPNWWSTVPAPVRVFLSDNDFSGKTLVPFCTHGGGGSGNSFEDIAKFCPKSTLLKGIAIPGSEAKTSQDTLAEWLKEIKMVQ